MIVYRHLPLLLVFLLTATISKAQLEKNPGPKVACKKFEIGSFYYENEDRYGILIIRKGKKQIEKNYNTGEVSKFKIEWIEKCEFNLTFLKSNAKTKLKKGWVIKSKITGTEEDGYEYEADLYGIINYGIVKRILSKAEKKEKLEEELEEIQKQEEEAEKLLAEEEKKKRIENGEEVEETEEEEGKKSRKKKRKGEEEEEKKKKGDKKEADPKKDNKESTEDKAKDKKKKKDKEKESEKPKKEEKNKDKKKSKEKNKNKKEK